MAATRVERRRLPEGRTVVMGILNVTPDSFADGGRYAAPEAALAHARRLIAEGADVIDVGGESTRPGALPIDATLERARVVPVIAALRAETTLPISVDTTKAEVAAAALAVGADMVNDVSAGCFDAGMLPLVAERGAAIVLMHMQGDPATMQDAPTYGDVVGEVAAFLAARAAAAREAGIAAERIWLDPGIGFGKRCEHNLALLAGLERLVDLGYPVVVGASRKGFLGALSGDPVDARLPASLAAAVLAAARGARVVRVHDVGATRSALAVADALARLGRVRG
ncbi:MAG: dihydropteroate synthase [Deltaproteobacteria bacterium]|nr:dihydropteroate synthase [Deltaproteobacteria bacterium]